MATVEELKKQLEKLEQENRDLKERLNTNSSNSSISVSHDMKKKKGSHCPSSGKSSGGEKGHKGYYRELLPTESVDKIKHCGLPDLLSINATFQK